MSDADAPEGTLEDFDGDFAPVDLTAAITGLLVHGETRDSIAAQLQISRAEVDGRIAEATGLSEAEALNEREWIIRERLRDLTRQVSDVALASYGTSRLSLLLELVKLEVRLIDWARRQGVN